MDCVTGVLDRGQRWVRGLKSPQRVDSARGLKSLQSLDSVRGLKSLQSLDSARGLKSLQSLDSELARLARSSGMLRVALGDGLEALARVGGQHELGFASVEGYGVAAHAA